jgi:hypothetical protein
MIHGRRFSSLSWNIEAEIGRRKRYSVARAILLRIVLTLKKTAVVSGLDLAIHLAIHLAILEISAAPV